ncbi:MAG TPA: DUF3526 domain-containing protein [Anaeromyxobacteraceae bacterium]|nr:DUF3526 domain-containing protein [Anaeromyxobacteraceae bacterium]
MRLLLVELRSLFAQRSVLVALVLLIVTCAAALASSTHRLREEEALDATLREDRQHTLDRLDRFIDQAPQTLAWFGDPRHPAFVALATNLTVARLEPGLLAPLAVGQRDVWPTAVRLGLPGSIMRELPDERFDRFENPHHQATGPLDLTFVIVFFIPLVVLVLAHDVVSAERERGTAFLLEAADISVMWIVAARLLARLVVVAGVLGAVALSGWALGARGALGPVLAWWAVAVAYAAFWFAVCAFIQTLRAASSTNAIMGGAAWLFFVLVWPIVTSLAAGSIAPIPSRIAYDLAKRDAKQRADLSLAADTKAFYAAHPELGEHAYEAAKGLTYATWFVPMLKARHSVEELRRQFDERLDAQQAVERALATFSPALSCFEGLEEAAGQGAERHRRFLRQAEAFDDAYADSSLDETMRFHHLDKQGLRTVAAFTFIEEAPAVSGGRFATCLMKLLAPFALVFAIAWIRMRRRSWI